MEVLVAVAILAVGVSLVLHAFAMSVAALEISRDSLHAGRLLREKMAEIQGVLREEGRLPDGPREGVFESAPDTGFRWRIDSAPIRVGPVQMGELTVTVWRHGARRRDTLCTRYREKAE